MTTLEDLVHLHALSFPLSVDVLPKLSSLELALVQFHFDTDDMLTASARRLFLSRRASAFEHPETIGRGPGAPRPVPREYMGLVTCLRQSAAKGVTHPLRSQIGAELKKFDRNIYEHPDGPTSWKQLTHDAEKRGFVILSTVHLPSREWISLAPEYAEPRSKAPALAFSKDFHLASLTSPIDFAHLASNSSAELLTIQFRDNISPDVPDDVEALWWKRRSAGLDAGLEWPADESRVAWKGFPDAPAALPSLAMRINDAKSDPPGSPNLDPDTPPSPGPIPSPQIALPPSVMPMLRTISITKLPLEVDAGPALAALLPEDLIPFASVLYAPSPATNTTRQAHIAYTDLDQRLRAVAALNDLDPVDGVKIHAEVQDRKQPKWEWGDVRMDAREKLWATVCSAKEQLWSSLVAVGGAGKHVKREADDAVPLDAEDADAKRRRLERFGVAADEAGRPLVAPPAAIDTKPPHSPPLPPYPTSVTAYSEYVSSKRPESTRHSQSTPSTTSAVRAPPSTSSGMPVKPLAAIATSAGNTPIPSTLLDPLFYLGVEFLNLPTDMRGDRVQTDLFSVRFGAVGYVTYLSRAPFQFFIAFEEPDGAAGVEKWVDDAKRYWKNNGLRTFTEARSLPDREWLWNDFTPAFRARHGNLADADVPAITPMWKAPPEKLDAWGRPLKALAPGHFAWEQFFSDDPAAASARHRLPKPAPALVPPALSARPRIVSPHAGVRLHSPPYPSDRGAPHWNGPPPPAPLSHSYSDRGLRVSREPYYDPRDVRDPAREYRDARDLRGAREYRDVRDVHHPPPSDRGFDGYDPRRSDYATLPPMMPRGGYSDSYASQQRLPNSPQARYHDSYRPPPARDDRRW